MRQKAHFSTFRTRWRSAWVHTMFCSVPRQSVVNYIAICCWSTLSAQVSIIYFNLNYTKRSHELPQLRRGGGISSAAGQYWKSQSTYIYAPSACAWKHGHIAHARTHFHRNSTETDRFKNGATHYPMCTLLYVYHHYCRALPSFAPSSSVSHPSLILYMFPYLSMASSKRHSSGTHTHTHSPIEPVAFSLFDKWTNLTDY